VGFFNALIVDPDTDCRIRLKQALRQVPQFDEVTSRGMLDIGEKPEELLKGIDVVFLSSRLDSVVLQLFAQVAKEDSNRGPTAVVTIRSKNVSKAEVATGYLAGVDGILLEPFSVNAVEEIAQIAESIRREDQERRFSTALRLLVQELGSQVSHLAEMERRQQPARITRAVLKEMGSVLHELEGPQLARYFDILCEVFPESEIPNPAEYESGKAYRGSSERIRRNVARDVITKLQDVVAA
jgi:DNA-binding NarL/FixJ family response regulator